MEQHIFEECSPYWSLVIPNQLSPTTK